MSAATKPMLTIGVLGVGYIARRFAEGIAGSDRVRIGAVASRVRAKAEAYAAAFAVPVAHGDYAALLADPAIQAVYIPLPNSLHAEWAIRAAAAGKHVLCEKPLATSEAEAVAIRAAARDHCVHIVEAYPYLAQPLFRELRRLIAAGAIGRIRLIHASFGFMLDDRSNIRFDAALGGGATFDAGSYPISLAQMLVGEAPEDVAALGEWIGPGVDREVAATLRFPGGATALLSCSFGAAGHRFAVITGTEGEIVTNFPNHTSEAAPGLLTLGSGFGQPALPIAVAHADGFRAEAEQFAALVAGEAAAWTGVSLDQSVAIAATIDRIRASAWETRRTEP